MPETYGYCTNERCRLNFQPQWIHEEGVKHEDGKLSNECRSCNVQLIQMSTDLLAEAREAKDVRAFLKEKHQAAR